MRGTRSIFKKSRHLGLESISYLVDDANHGSGKPCSALPISHDEASRSQNSREYLVYLVRTHYPVWNGFGLKPSSHCRLALDRVETIFCIFIRDEFAELLAEICDIFVKFSLNHWQLFFSMQTFSPRQNFSKI
jgi:hypothetical protein